jgi:glycosyltransferase involved in cell wall biosynthesis
MGTPSAKATIIISFRERWSLTLESIASIIGNTAGPFQLWLLDTGMPDVLRQAAEARYAGSGLRVIDVPGGLWPNQARGRIAAQIETPYAVFIDNDVLVTPGWLDALVACAEQTGAGIVGPLYLWGPDGGSDLIHMAGGDLAVEQEPGGLVMAESHRHLMKRVADMEAQLVRETCGFSEYHCMLMRREVFRDPRVFDDDICCVHEHIHASLVARELGYATWVEPASRVLYLAFAPWRLGELPLLRKRWDREAGERSIQHFARRWNVIDDARSFGGVRGFLEWHTSMVDPLLAGRGAAADRRATWNGRTWSRPWPDCCCRRRRNATGRTKCACWRMAPAWRCSCRTASTGPAAAPS